MARYAGNLGIRQDLVETEPGIFTEAIVDVKVSGYYRREALGAISGDRAQDDLTLNHIISIYAPESAAEKFSKAVYIEWQGEKWTVKSIEYARPRFNIRLGGKYNGSG
jgi:hypothetical protein